jgi:hypothetical protein
MSIEVTAVDDPDEWNRLLDRADAPTPFHRYEALDVCADHADADLHALVGYKGQEPVGLFPIFALRTGPMVTAMSPPPRLKIPYLGPILLFAGSPKRRRREKQHRRFLESCLDWLQRECAPRFTNVRTAVGYRDARPFHWHDFEVTPRYTYLVDLTPGPEELLSRFSSDARRNVRAEYDADVVVEQGGTDVIDRIVRHSTERHAQQDEDFPVTTAFVADLYRRLPDGVVRPYQCLVDGEFATGVVDLEYAGRGHAWIGRAKSDCGLPVNDLLDWGVFRDSMERGVDDYDLVGANNERLSTYKSKFGPDLVPYYEVQRGPWALTMASKLYGYLK